MKTNESGIRVKPNHNFKSYNQWHIILVFVLALAIRLILFGYYLGVNPAGFLPCIDSHNYIELAKNLLAYGMIGAPPYPDVYWTPLYPVFIAGVYLLTAYSTPAVIIIQLLISSLGCCLLYITAARHIPKGIALTVALALAPDVPTVGYANTILSETLFSFLLILFIFTFTLFLEQNKMYLLVLSGLLCGSATLTRPVLFYFSLFSIFIFLYYYRNHVYKIMVYFFIFNLSLGIVVGPWIYRNVKLGYNGIAAVQEVNIYIFKAGWIEQKAKTGVIPQYIDSGERFEKVKEIISQRGMANTPYNRVKLYKELGTQTLREYPELLLEYQAVYTSTIFTDLGVDRVFAATANNKEVDPQIIKAVSFAYRWLLGIAYGTFFIGLVSRKTWSKSRGLVAVLLLLAYLTALSGEWGGASRFRVPLMPLILLISGIGMESTINILKKGGKNIKIFQTLGEHYG